MSFRPGRNLIENLYHTVSRIGCLLKIELPELAAIISTKYEEAKTNGIKFYWHVKIQDGSIPLTPEDLTQLTGNFLDNALDAVKANGSPRIDLILVCNKLGLELKVSNNGSPSLKMSVNIFLLPDIQLKTLNSIAVLDFI